MKLLYTQYAPIRKRIFSSYFLLLLMGKSKPGSMTIWDQELTMMHLAIGALCFTVLMEAGCFLVELVKKEILFLWNGMKVKEPLRELTLVSGRNQLEVLCSLIQLKITF
nr:Topless-related protein [Ipomoea batatas]